MKTDESMYIYKSFGIPESQIIFKVTDTGTNEQFYLDQKLYIEQEGSAVVAIKSISKKFEDAMKENGSFTIFTDGGGVTIFGSDVARRLKLEFY